MTTQKTVSADDIELFEVHQSMAVLDRGEDCCECRKCRAVARYFEQQTCKAIWQIGGAM